MCYLCTRFVPAASVRVSSSAHLVAWTPQREPGTLECDGTIMGSGCRCDSPGFVDHVRRGFHLPSAYVAESRPFAGILVACGAKPTLAASGGDASPVGLRHRDTICHTQTRTGFEYAALIATPSKSSSVRRTLRIWQNASFPEGPED